MSLLKVLRVAAVTLACVGMLAPSVKAANPVRDVALQSGGVLTGFAVDEQGNARAGVNVMCLSKGELVAKATTDREGKFSFTNLRGGVYELKSDLGGGAFRAWAPRTAPPKASNGVLLVDGKTIRANHGNGHQILKVLSNPWVIAAIVTAAIVIPLAVDGDDAT